MRYSANCGFTLPLNLLFSARTCVQNLKNVDKSHEHRSDNWLHDPEPPTLGVGKYFLRMRLETTSSLALSVRFFLPILGSKINGVNKGFETVFTSGKPVTRE